MRIMRDQKVINKKTTKKQVGMFRFTKTVDGLKKARQVATMR